MKQTKYIDGIMTAGIGNPAYILIGDYWYLSSKVISITTIMGAAPIIETEKTIYKGKKSKNVANIYMPWGVECQKALVQTLDGALLKTSKIVSMTIDRGKIMEIRTMHSAYRVAA